MKIKFKILLNLIFLFCTLNLSVVLANDVPPPTPLNDNNCQGGWDCNDDQPGQGTGRPAPINDYAGLLIVSGFIAASAIYFKKEQLNKQNK